VTDQPRGNTRRISPGNYRNASRIPLVMLMVGSLVAASVWRNFALRSQRDESVIASGAGSLGQFNSYTLGLLLGGLRGPLVMTLWSSSEAQKGERNLEDINTKIELIRLLQPEFDAVHLFQIWNKAYNLSVQMSNLPSKYATILDALAYADSAREDKANINLESAVASIYFDKLGSASEKQYYRQRVRDETRAPSGQTQIVFPIARRDEFVTAALAAGADSRRYTLRPQSGAEGRLSVRLRDEFALPLLKTFTGPDVQTTHIEPASQSKLRSSLHNSLDPRLDEAGRLLPEYAASDTMSSTSAPTTNSIEADDARWRPELGELAYLKRFEPYPYGVSPFALAYDYYKRSVALQEDKKQKHAQLSDRVISSRPALSLKSWAEEEIELGRQAEMAQFGLVPLPEEKSPLPSEMPATAIPIDPIPMTPLLAEAIYNYGHAADLGERSVSEFKSHVRRYKDDLAIYTSQLADVAGRSELSRGDSLYLKLVTTSDPAARAELAKQAADHYRKAIEFTDRNVLAFYVPDPVIAKAFPKGYGKLDVINSFDNPSAFPSELVDPTLKASLTAMASNPEYAPGSEIGEYETYIDRATTRLKRLEPLLK
jgi:hypothetical protein